VGRAEDKDALKRLAEAIKSQVLEELTTTGVGTYVTSWRTLAFGFHWSQVCWRGFWKVSYTGVLVILRTS
jgi:hypothetical protein